MTDVIKDLPEFQKLDTTVVQVRSVLNFMFALSYQLDDSCKSGRFVTNVKAMQGNRFLSMESAVRMHNLTVDQWDVYQHTVTGDTAAFPQGVSMQHGFTALGVKLAMASKLVETAKYNTNRHGVVAVKSVMVKPLNKTVAEMLEAV